MGELSVADNRGGEDLTGVSLLSRRELSVRQLPGFRKSKHQVPMATDHRSQEFVARLGGELVKADLDNVFDGLRAHLKLKRREVEVSESSEGFGTIRTPFFLYSNGVCQSEENPAQAVWYRQLIDLASANVLCSEECSQLFPDVFDTCEITTGFAIDMAALIDHVEDLTEPVVDVDYDRNLRNCRISFPGTSLIIDVERDRFCLRHAEPLSPGQLLTSFQEIRGSVLEFSRES